MRFQRSWLLDSLLLFALAAALIWPLFRLEYMANWGSIESTFIADGRFLRDHWPHPGWQPLWYCGTRFDYVYPPALRYGTAILSLLLSVETARAYHLYTAILYCLGIAGVYLLARAGSLSRGWAWVSALAAGLVSPAFLLLGDMRLDAATVHLPPQRLNVLLRYGEGPHMSAVAILGVALAASWAGLRRGRPAMLALAAVASALVVSTNFYGANALAILYPVLVWALWIACRDHRIWLRAAAVAALAYGLTAAWLSPSYVRITLANLRLVSEPGNTWSAALGAAVAALFLLLSWRLARGRQAMAWPVFVAGACALMSLNVLGNHYFRFRVAGEPLRLVPELDLVLILGIVEALRRLWALRWPRVPRWLPRAMVIIVLAMGFREGRRYVRHAWTLYPPQANHKQRVEYRVTEWMAKNMPEARAVATGSVRFWYNAWFDLAQVGGGSEQGVLNQIVEWAQWEFTQGEQPENSVLWMQALGTDAIIVHDRTSEEIYHDYLHPRKFDAALPLVFDDGRGNRIYRAPRRFPWRARVVDGARTASLQPIRLETAPADLRAYVEAIERGPDSPAVVSRESPAAMRIRARLAPGEQILVQESYDPAWRAYAGGRRLPVRPDVIGFMLIEAPPGEQEIRLVFETPLENRVGRALTLISLALVGWLAVKGARR